MKKIISKTAITLIELIVSMVLVSVVLLGIFSINAVLSNNNQDYGQRYLVRSATQNALNHVLNNASSAIGSISGSTVILYGTNGTLGLGPDLGNYNASTFCIHQNIPATPTGTNTIDNQPPNASPGPPYTSDRWLCYTWYPSGNALPYQIWYCAMAFTQSPPYYGASNCSAENAANITAGPVYLGTAFTAPNVTYPTASNGFSITVQNCLNNSATGTATCGNNGVSGDMVNNPEVQISGNVTPDQVSS